MNAVLVQAYPKIVSLRRKKSAIIRQWSGAIDTHQGLFESVPERRIIGKSNKGFLKILTEGDYKIGLDVSFSGRATDHYLVEVLVNRLTIGLKLDSRFVDSEDVYEMSLDKRLHLKAGDKVQVSVDALGSEKDILINRASLSVR